MVGRCSEYLLENRRTLTFSSTHPMPGVWKTVHILDMDRDEAEHMIVSVDRREMRIYILKIYYA